IGHYLFTGLAQNTNYWVVVDSKTVSGALNSGYTTGDIWAEQTFGDGGSKFGGLTAGVSDDASSLATAQHVSAISLENSDFTDVDFGFSFNVVTNTLGGDTADHDILENRTLQGTLRQFVANANAISGGNEMRFVPGTAPNQLEGNDGWWEIAVSNALPVISDAQTTIDGRAFDSTDGITQLNTNTTSHTWLLGPDGLAGTGDETVGVGADGVPDTGDETILNGLNGPELEIYDISGLEKGISIDAADVKIGFISIHGFGQLGANNGNIYVDTAGDRVHIHDNLIGSEAGTNSIPSTAEFSNHGIMVENADNGIIEDNLISFNAHSGIRFSGITGVDHSDGWLIQNNQITQNALKHDTADGLHLSHVANTSITNNFISEHRGYGIDTFASSGALQISNNTIVGNGTGAIQKSGIRLFGNGSVIEHNLIIGNDGPGVLVLPKFSTNSTVFAASIENLISQNSFVGNAGTAIDLVSDTADTSQLTQGDGVSDNTSAGDLNSGNDGVDHPELTEAFIDGTTLNIFGSIDLLATFDRLEIYLGTPGAGDQSSGVAYGEGEIYLGTIAIADFVTLDPTGKFHATFVAPSGSWPAQLTSGGTITAIGIQATGNTSEFSNNVINNDAPDAALSQITLNEDATHVFKVADFEFNDSDHLNFQRIIIETLPPNGTLYFSGIAIDPLLIPLSVSRSNIVEGILTFEPTPDENGISYSNFQFRVNDGISTGSSATLNIDVAPINDAPIANDDTYTTPEDTLRDVTDSVLNNDTDIDNPNTELEANVVIEPSHGQVQMNKDGTFKYTPDQNFYGIDTFIYRVLDRDGKYDEATVKINVLPINDAPTFDASTPDWVYVNENQINVIQFVASDVESDTFSFSMADGMIDDNSLFAINPTSGQLTFQAAPDFENPGGISDDGTYVLNIQVTDTHGDHSLQTLEVRLVNENEAPNANDDSTRVDEGAQTTIDVTVNDSDPDDDFLKQFSSVTIVDGPANGTASVTAEGNIIYVHNGDEVFSDSITYQIIDQTGLADTATVTITINPIEDQTEVHDDFIGSLKPGEQLIVDAGVLLINDIDDDSVLTFEDIVITDQPFNGSVQIIGGELVVIADSEARGFITFEYQVVADGVSSETAEVQALITAPFVPPTSEEPDPESEEETSEPEESEEDPSSQPETNETPDADTPVNESTGKPSLSDNAEIVFFNDSADRDSNDESNEFKVKYIGATYAYASRVEDVSLTNLAGIWVSKNSEKVSQFETTMLAALIWDNTEANRNELMMNHITLGASQIAASAAGVLTVGYLAWIIRGGVLLTTFMSSIPAWSSFDILSVLDSSGNESIEQMVDL
ncbi:MAG: Ig-like domain-containing protein, partial [Mariniblastus sp.]|nr:Ig-like domain-containing protein [Mariniblastus sp.]